MKNYFILYLTLIYTICNFDYNLLCMESENSADYKKIDCSLCYESLKNISDLIKFNCNHTFHQKCLKGWQEKNPEKQITKSCPTCIFRKNFFRGTDAQTFFDKVISIYNETHQ